MPGTPNLTPRADTSPRFSLARQITHARGAGRLAEPIVGDWIIRQHFRRKTQLPFSAWICQTRQVAVFLWVRCRSKGSIVKNDGTEKFADVIVADLREDQAFIACSYPFKLVGAQRERSVGGGNKPGVGKDAYV